ncbi:hypothetical protein BG005_007275 [Podila minutissima]|nr:hypothetical protein BG005_007275 [Podila minutissima]
MQEEVPRTTTIERQHWIFTDMIFFLYHTICTFHVIVPIMFWGYSAYSGDAKMMAIDLQPEPLWRNYSFHGGDLVLMVLEILVNAMPFIPAHFSIVFVTCLLYLGEVQLVHYVDGIWIYPFLDTSVGPIWVLLYFGVGVAIACAFVFMYYLHRSRNWVWRTTGVWTPATENGCLCKECAQRGSDLEGGLGDRGMEPHPNSYSEDTIQSMTELPMSADQVKDQYYQQEQEKAGGYFDQVRAAIMRPLGALSQSQNRKRSSSSGSDVSTASTLVGEEESKVEKGASDLEQRGSMRLEKVEEENEEDAKEAALKNL